MAPTSARVVVLIGLVALFAVPSEISFAATHTTTEWVSDLVVGLAFAAAGIYTWVRRPANPTGLLMYGVGLFWFPSGMRFGELPDVLTTIGWVMGAGWNAIFLAAVLLSFPHGRIASRFDRALMAAVVGSLTVVAWIRLPFLDPSRCEDCPQGGNLLAVAPDAELAASLASLHSTLNILLAAVTLVRVVIRLRRATPPGRYAMMPLVGTGAIVLAALVGYVARAVPIVAYNAALLLMPAGMVGGALRTRVTRSGVGELVVALGTNPPPGRLRELLAASVGDPSLQLGFPGPEGKGFVDHSGRPLSLPAPGDSRAVTPLAGSVLVHDPALLDDPGLIESVAAAARIALENARLEAQVRAQLEEVRESRQRIVEASDAERRRIERDLHDGAQQRLLSLSMSLRSLHDRFGDDLAPAASALVDQAAAEALTALAEIRELARGVHPPVLTNDGLGPALESLAERAPLPVVIEALPERRLPSVVEIPAFFVCSEAVVNAAKSAHATHVWISAREVDGAVELEVRDDGIGGARMVEGGGLAGLRDRVEAVGGHLGIDSVPGTGTAVRARIPVPDVASAELPV